MLNDMKLSQKTMEQFADHKSFKSIDSKLKFNVNVLTSNFWPSFMVTNPKLPTEMENCCNSFETFYSETYSGRKLTWQTSIGGGTIKAKFPLGDVEVFLSTYQMMILLLVNDDPELTFKTIITKTQVNEKDLKRNLSGLFSGKFKLLIKSGDAKEVTENDVFKINKYFKSDKSTIKIGQSGGSKESSSEDKTKSNTERFTQIDQSIISVMKKKQKT